MKEDDIERSENLFWIFTALVIFVSLAVLLINSNF